MTVVIQIKRPISKRKYEYLKKRFKKKVYHFEIKKIGLKPNDFFDGWRPDEIRKYCEMQYGKGVYRVYRFGGNPQLLVLYEDPHWKELK